MLPVKRRFLAFCVAAFLLLGLSPLPGEGSPAFACQETGDVFTPVADASGNYFCCCQSDITEFVRFVLKGERPTQEEEISGPSCCYVKASPERQPATAATPAPSMLVFLLPVSPDIVPTPALNAALRPSYPAHASVPRAPPGLASASPRAPPFLA